jgi:hypothetical protein
MKRLLLAVLLVAVATPAWALRCGSRVVTTGDRDLVARDRCGAPYYTDQMVVVDVYGADGPVERQVENVYEVWYYNFGPRKLMVRLLFLNGRLEREDTLGYGVNDIGDSCSLDSYPTGMSAGEIVAYCGLPASRTEQREAIVRRDGLGRERYRPIRRETWTYDLGSTRLLRVLTIENGRLQSVDTERR